MAELRVCVLAGSPVEERRHPLTAPIRIGRGPDCEILLDDTKGLVVTVVDRLGFEWPEPPAGPPAGALVFGLKKTTQERTNAGPVTVTLDVRIRIDGARLTGTFGIKRVMLRGRGRESLEMALALGGAHDEKTGKIQGTVSGADRAVRRDGSTRSWPRTGSLSGEVRGETATVRIDAKGGIGPYTGTFPTSRLAE